MKVVVTLLEMYLFYRLFRVFNIFHDDKSGLVAFPIITCKCIFYSFVLPHCYTLNASLSSFASLLLFFFCFQKKVRLVAGVVVGQFSRLMVAWCHGYQDDDLPIADL